MEISTNLIQKYIGVSPSAEKSGNNINNNSVAVDIKELPSVYPAGMSQVNANKPVAYSKIGEISVPGSKEKASVFKLANGQKVIIFPKKGPTYIKTTYNVGSLNETEDIRGMSHYIEHNLFNGSKGLAPREYDKKVSELGGSTNASTGLEKTDYYLSLQLLKDSSLEEGIKLNAMQTQFPSFPVEQLEKEKEPVKSEIDLYKDNPYDVASGIALKNLFNIQTNSSNFVLGTKDNINSFTREQVLDYYNTWYTPDNAVTVITGDVDTEETIRLVSKYYNKPMDLSKINQRHYEPIQYTDKPVRTDIIQQNASSADIFLGFAIPEGTSKNDLDKINTLLSLLMSSNSRLSKALDKYGLSSEIYTENMQNKPDGAKAILAHVSMPEDKIEDVLKILYEEITYIANNPPSLEELNNIKRRSINSLEENTEESQNINSTLTNIALTNNFNYFEDTIRNIQNISPEDISDTARKFLDLNKVSVCVSHEKTASPDSINQNYNSALNSQKTISFGAARRPEETLSEETRKIKQFKLWNNIETMIIPGNSTGKSVITVNFNTDELNSVTSPAFMVLNELINRGSSLKDNHTYNEIKTSKDMGIVFSAGVDGLNVSAVFDDENFTDAMSLIKETLLYPNFSQSEFDRAKQIIKDSILSENVSACDKLNQELFPAMKKYASKEERLKQLDALTLADVQNLYSGIISSSQVNAVLTAPVEEKPYLQDMFNKELSAGMPVFRPFSKEKGASYNIYAPNIGPKMLTAAKEQAQAEIFQAYKYKRTENIDDLAKIELLTFILGGGMSSRLFTDLREDKKLAYSVGAEGTYEKDCSAIVLDISTTTDSPDPQEGSPENVRKALDGFERNVNLLKTENISSQELENAKIQLKTMMLDIPETNTGKTNIYASSKYSPYDIKYLEKMLNAIDKVTAEDIKAAANYVFQNPPITSIAASQKTLDTLNL